MRAIVIEQFGGPEVLKAGALPVPAPGAGEVLVRVEAARMNPVDVQTRRGDYAANVRPPMRLGIDAAGVVEAVGPGVSAFAAGDEGFYASQALANERAYAEYHVERADLLVREPSGLTFAEAASVPIAAQTAWVCLFERAALRPAEGVLLLTGTGAVGLMAIQLARAAGAYVVASGRAAHADLVLPHGADATFDQRADPEYAEEARRLRPGGYDVILDGIGGAAIERSLGLLAPGGRLVSIVDQPAPQNLLAGWLPNATVHLVFLAPEGRRLARIAELLDRGVLRPVVERTLRLEEAAAAHRLIDAGGRRGKIVLDCR